MVRLEGFLLHDAVRHLSVTAVFTETHQCWMAFDGCVYSRLIPEIRLIFHLLRAGPSSIRLYITDAHAE